MKTTNNILSKIFFFLILAAGWGGSAWADAVFVTPTYVSSTNAGSGGEGPEKLVDGRTNTKWGVGYTNGSSRPSVVVRVNGGMVLHAYKLFNGNDTNSQPGRRWKKWTIEGSNDQNTWTPIHTIYDGRMNTTNFAENLFTVKDNNTSYEYYRITVLNNEGAGMIQMSELQFSSSPLTEFPTLRENVNVSFVGGEAPVKYYDPESETPITITAGAKNYGNILYDARFFGAVEDINYSCQSVEFNNAAQTLNLTLALNKWYKVKANNGNRYLSSDYNENGRLYLRGNNACPEPANYAGFWRLVRTGLTAENVGGLNVQLYNAKFYDSKQVGFDHATWNNSSGNQAQAYMYDSNATGAYTTVFEQRANGSNQTFRVVWDKANNSYFNVYSGWLSLWNSGSGFGDANAQFTITEVPMMGEAVNVIVNAPGGETVKFSTQCEGTNFLAFDNVTDQTMANGTFNFHNMPFLESLFSLENATTDKSLTVDFDESSQTLTLTVKENPYLIRYSSEPTASGWAADTKWFTLRNNRTGQSYNRSYITTSAASVTDNGQMLPILAAMPDDLGSYWCFVGDNTHGFVIQNAAYGPDYVLGIKGNDRQTNEVRMLHKDNIPSGFNTLFTAVSNAVIDDATHAWAFRIGLTGNSHLHVTNGTFIRYNHEAINSGDTGSAFKLTAVSQSVLDALTQYDVYTINVKGAPGSFEVTYRDASKVFGRRGQITDGATFIVEKGSSVTRTDFQGSTTDYLFESVNVTNQEGHACKLLTIRLRDALATDPWLVRVTDGYHAIYAGDELNDRDNFYLRPGVTPQHIDFTIDAPADKFVWGPVIDNRAKTVNYEVRDRATELSTGWYQLQVAEANVASLRDKIKTEEGNINTSANTLYLAPAVYEPGDNKIFKVTGVPQYANEGSTYVRIVNNGNNNYTFINPITGASISADGFTFSNGLLTKSNGWSVADHPLEGPYLQNSGSQSMAFNVSPMPAETYDVYKVTIESSTSVDDVRLSISNPSTAGNATVANGGFLFLKARAVAPLATQFSVKAGGVDITGFTVGAEADADGAIPVTITVVPRQTLWTVNIIGNAHQDADRVTYKGAGDYKHGDQVAIPEGTTPTALDFKTNVTDRFVWGPVFDKESKTVTFEIKTPVDVTAQSGTPLTTSGWYQFMLVPYTTTGANFINTVNDNSVAAKSRQGSYLYMFNAEQEYVQSAANHYPMKFAAVPASGDQATSFFYVNANGQTPRFQAIDGHYVQDNGCMTTSPTNMQKMEAINNQTEYGQNIYGIYRWSAFYQNNTGPERPYVGASGTTLNYYVRAVKVNPADDYDVYTVNLAGTGLDKVKYIGKDNHGIAELYDHGYLFLTKGTTLTEGNFRFDGNVVVNEITIDESNPAMKVVTFNVTAPTFGKEIVHRQAYYYDELESDPNQPADGFIKEGEGMNTRQGAGGVSITEQNMAVYEIPVYLMQGTSCTSYMPTDQVRRYQRWYNWDTDSQVDPAVLTSLPGWNVTAANTYTNGHLTGADYGGFHGDPTLTLPTTMTEYNVGLDMAHYPTRGTIGSAGALVEPTLAMRIVYQVRDAKIIAKEIKDKTKDSKFYEVHNISFPNVKRGNLEDKTIGNLVPLDMDLNNYWIFNDATKETNAELQQLLASGGATLEAVLDVHSEGAELKNVKMIDNTADAVSGNIRRSEGKFERGHFVLFQYPDGGVIPAGATATINVYIKNNAGTIRYNLAQFNLTFIANSEPVAVTELNGSFRHPDALHTTYGNPVAKLTFDNKTNNEFGTFYKYPLDYKGVSYAFGTEVQGGGHTNYFASRGEYSLGAQHTTSKALGGGSYTYYPVNNYLRSMGDASASFSAKEADSYCLYIDAADQPGKVASIELNEVLCAGSRLYCYGYIGCTSGGTDQNPTSVLINVMGIDKDTKKEVLIYSYCPGIITLRAYDQNNRRIYAAALGRGTVYEAHGSQADYWAPWQQIGFNFAIDSKIAGQMSGYSIQIVNNAWDSNGADTVLDDFGIYVKPPKGDVDFTTPLCSDKVRHAKIHADYDMLRDLSGVNDNVQDAKIELTYCFLDAEVFDNYTENGVSITDVFEVNAQGNHNLKVSLTDDVEKLVNHAFGAALVGSRRDKETPPFREDHGFHSYFVSLDYESMPKYAYHDSKKETIYREEVDGVRRIVFKEDIVRGEMSQRQDEDGHWYWPYMRPSKMYYLVFAPMKVPTQNITDHDVATQVFSMHENCSFLGKFITKDPMHVILDNADIESDLPMKAICHGESAEFQFDMPALKADKPVYDEEYCISDEDLNGQMVPESYATHHYHYEASFNNEDVYGVIKNLPYDWWLGGKYDETHSYRGTIEVYRDAVHPNIVYNHDLTDPNHTHTHPADYKKHGEPVDISLAMEDFRFYYPDFGMGKTDIYGHNTLTDADWDALKPHDYNNDSGYSLLQTEINAIRDLVEKGILVLYRNTFDMPLTLEKSESLTLTELNEMMEKEMNDQVLALALELNDETIKHLLPLKQLERTVLEMLSLEGRKSLTFEEFGNLKHDELLNIAKALRTADLLTYTDEQLEAMPESTLHYEVETVLKRMTDDELHDFALNNFPDIGHERRAYLVVRALNILSKETLAGLTEEEMQNTTLTRSMLREKMILLFSQQDVRVLKKMLKDTSAKLTEEEQEALLKDKDPESMNSVQLAVVVEDALAILTNNVIADFNSDRYINFTLLPIMPSQENFVDEPYIFCPDPRGVKVRVTTNSPRMLNGFADMPYPANMDKVPVRIGLAQIEAVPYNDADDAKSLRMPLRGLSSAQKNGTHEVAHDKGLHLQGSGYENYLYLAETNDPRYQAEPEAQGQLVMKPAKVIKGGKPEDPDAFVIIGKVKRLKAEYSADDNFMDIQFDKDAKFDENLKMKFREGYTYRLGFNFMEHDAEDKPTISCYGTMLFDIKIVPEYQKWTGAVNDDWTNDKNWARADRADLHADNLPVGDVIDGSTAFAKTSANDKEAAERYPTNADNKTAESFIPMAFTNTLIAENASNMPALYRVDVPERSKKETVGEKEVTIPGHFLGEPKPKVEGVPNDDKTPAAPLKPTASVDAKYDMEVYAATGSWSDAGNYECGLFGTYVAKGITFEPATSLYNAQLLNYQKAWVEYALNTKRWYTLASPLQETYSGEWYSPTGVLDDETPANHTAGRQLTPHFYGITYKTELNDRFNPAYYQRSWDKATVNLYQCEQESAIFGENPYNAYRALTWSKVYNDVQVDYTNGGFSVKTLLADEDESPEHASEYHEVLVRMPKEDAAFDYYDPANVHPGHNTPIARTAAHHRLNSDLLNTSQGLVQTLKNDNESEYYLVANPFIAPMDMDAFFAENTQFAAGKYWILADDKQEANVKVDDTWISTNATSNGDVAPLQAFFVKRNGKTDQEISVTYTAEMQAANNGVLPLKMRAQSTGDAPAAFTISNGESDALCYFAGDADAEYREGEDAELLLDSNLSDHVTTVFTAASGQALHVNVLPLNVTTIPVGVIAPEDDTETVLTFTGVEHLEAVMPEQPHLYDAATGEFSPVEEGTEIAIEGTSSGRYYIVSGQHLPYTGIDIIADDADEDADLYNLHGIRVASPQQGNITIRGTRKEYHKR